MYCGAQFSSQCPSSNFISYKDCKNVCVSEFGSRDVESACLVERASIYKRCELHCTSYGYEPDADECGYVIDEYWECMVSTEW